MKRIALLLLIVLPFLARAQNVSGSFFDRYSKSAGFSSIQLERRMMRMMSRQASERGDEKLARLLNGIESIRIVALDGGDGEPFIEDAEALVDHASYRFQLVMSESREGQETRFYLRKALPPGYSELVMLTAGPRETVAVNIYGQFDLKQVSRLSTLRPKRSADSEGGGAGGRESD